MSDKQRQKILDVMHTLSVIANDRSVDPKKSARACWNVLEEVLKLEATDES